MKLYVCQEHVDKAMDVVVDEYETFPRLEPVDEEKSLSTACEYCGERSIYMVANIGSSTI
ncbi:CxxH/CxxC protein [Pontibacillus yanchengensis]|uniref:CxxH/CxxC protein n=2 Tax=Pontibacillus yanchengensis TaxID=462910 RepID=A0ACC7VJB9_9BACI|nr:CxxH/CxxC protein [Pontibacillus yanchengensis]MYL34463.1 CxxH/CxxC protein [Pontibacillus yanchengensis]MYL54271.1 CxxH/CxxC protein [Pontibacillus yanchengensis]